MIKLRLKRPLIGAIAALTVLSPLSLRSQVFNISGTVTNTIGSPMVNADVFFFDDQGDPIGIPSTVTNALGGYLISNVPNGTWGVKIEPRSVDKVLPLLQNVTVAGSDVALNFVLPAGNLISGFIRDIAGAPLPGIDLNVRDRETGDILDTPGDNSDIFGFYDIVIPDGRFRIFYRPVQGEKLLPFVINDIEIVNDTTIDVVLLAAAVVSGRVLSTTGQPIANVDLDFIDAATGLKLDTPNDKTDFMGNYATAVPAGIYDIEFEPLVSSRMIAKVILGVNAPDDIVLNVTLDSGLSVSGFVRNSAGIGVAGADIDVRDPVTRVKVFTPFDNTDTTGHYEVIVPAGTFDLIYQPVLLSRLAPVEFLSTVINTDAVFDVTVLNGFILTATILDNIGIPVPGVDIDLIDAFSGIKVPLVGDVTPANGTISVVAVPSTYFLEVQPPLATRMIAKRIENVALTMDITLPVINLDPGILLSGNVTDSLGTPVVDADIDAVLAPLNDMIFTPFDNTDLFGHYEVVIPTGVFTLLYKPDSLSGIMDTIVLSGVAINVDTTINVSFQSSMPACCVGATGNVNNDPADIADIADLTLLIDHLFINFPPLDCREEGNIDGDPAGVIDIADLTLLIDHLFINFPPTADCL